MAASRCDQLRVNITNTVKYTDGKDAPIVLIAAQGDNDSSLNTEESGSYPVVPPVTINPNTTKTLYAHSGDGSGGWATGSITVQCPYGTSTNQNNPVESIDLTYSCQPQGITNDSKDPILDDTIDDSRSNHFSATVDLEPDYDSDQNCAINFTILNSDAED